MTPWVVNVTNVINGTGNLTQLFPNFVGVGSGSQTLGAIIRQPTDGTLSEMSIYPSGNFGGEIELWDVAGPLEGSPNVNEDAANNITDTYLTAQIARKKAKLIWKQGFKADSGLTTKKYTQRIPIMFGLAVRIIDNTGAAGTQAYTLNIVAGGCYRYIERII